MSGLCRLKKGQVKIVIFVFDYSVPTGWSIPSGFLEAFQQYGLSQSDLSGTGQEDLKFLRPSKTRHLSTAVAAYADFLSIELRLVCEFRFNICCFRVLLVESISGELGVLILTADPSEIVAVSESVTYPSSVTCI